MKIISNEFKEEIAKLGRQIDFKINLHINDKIITQDNKFLITQDNMKLIVEQFNEEEIDETIGAEDIYNASIVTKGNLLSTMMKEFDFEITEDLRIGDLVDCSFGLKVGDEYEYVNYGKFIIYSKEFNEDTKTYSYVAFDSMLFTMKEFENSVLYTGTLFNVIPHICEDIGLECDDLEELTTTYPNLGNIIDSAIFDGIEMTYRDVLDIICQALGLSMIVEDKTLKLKPLNNTIVDTFDGNYLKDTNVRFNKKYMINSVVLSRSEDNDNIYRRDEESVAENGVHEFKIKDNLILNDDDREYYIDEIFEQLNGVEFYINDFTSTGITYLDWLDYYNVEIDGKTYKCLMLNDEIKIQQGLEESIYTDEPEETVTDYKTSSKTDKEVSFIVDKQKGEIKSRVTQDEMETAISQTAEEINIEVSKKVGNNEVISKINQSAEQITINANKLNLQGYITATDLSGSGTTTINGANINTGTIQGITLSGNTITGGTITAKAGFNENNPYINVIDSRNTEMVPIETRIWGNGISVWDYSNNPNANIRTEVNGMYAELYNGVVNAYGFNNISLAETKKNFEKLKSGLDIINATDIYKYNYIAEEDSNKKHIGIVIGDEYKYSNEIISSEKKGVDTYSMVSVCFRAIQEQQEQINSLKEEIKKLKESDK